MAAGRGTVVVEILGDSGGFSKTLAAVETESSAAFGKVSGHANKAGESVEGVGKSAQSAHEGGIGHLAGGLGALAGGFAAVEVGKEVIGEFTSLEDATAKLGQAMKDAGEKDTPKFREELEKAQSAGEHLGFGAAATTESIAKLRLAGVDTTRAMEVQTGIMDLARAKHLDLATATDAVVKGMQGQGKALKDLNVELPPHLATTAQLDAANAKIATTTQTVALEQQKYSAAVAAHGVHSAQAVAAAQTLAKAQAALTAEHKHADEIQAGLADRTHQLGAVMDTLNDKVGGQAQAATETLSGKLEVLKTEAIGAADKGIGAMMPVLGALTVALGFLADHLDIVGPILLGLVGVFVMFKSVLMIAEIIKGVTAAIGLLNGAMTFLAANPIVLVIAAIVAIVAALVILEVKFHWIETVLGALSDAFSGGFETIKGIVSGAISFIGDHWQLILAILTGPIGIAVKVISDHLDAIEGFFKGLPQRIANALGGLAGMVGGVIKGAMNAMIWPINQGLQAMGDLGFDGHYGIPGFHVRDLTGGTMPQIPTFHTGGIVSGVPGQDVLALLQAGERVQPATGATLSGAAAGGGDTHVEVNVQTQADPYVIAREVAWALHARG